MRFGGIALKQVGLRALLSQFGIHPDFVLGSALIGASMIIVLIALQWA
jgi:hypothetical protein